MANQTKNRARWRVVFLGLTCLVMVLALSGCQAIRFYSQAVAGQYEILAHQTPIDELIAAPGTDPKLKSQLELVLKIRQFAATELKLRPGGSYLKYVDLHRPFVVWNVNVAPPLSLDPKTWWFPIVGSVSYRGYFSEQGARRYAELWDKKGWDTYVGQVTTYSTLGWFKDPLLNTFLFESEADLTDTIFHELTHQRLFIAGDTEFNESFAVTVAGEGVRRWYQATTNTHGYQQYLQDARQEADFLKLVMAMRGELQAVYENAQWADAAKLQRKEEIIAQTRGKFAKLKATWGVGSSGYDRWFAEPLNNAQLNTVAAYYDLVPSFQALLLADGGDLEKFYNSVADLAKLPLAKRHETLRAYLNSIENKRT